jgi:hypothetical protein
MTVDADIGLPMDVAADIDKDRTGILVVNIEILMLAVHQRIPLVVNADESLLVTLAPGKSPCLFLSYPYDHDLISDLPAVDVVRPLRTRVAKV